MGYDHINSQPITEIKDDSNLIADSNVTANTFNYFLSNVGPFVANKIPKHCDILDYMSGNLSESVGVTDTNSDEIISTFNLWKSDYSIGADDISSVVTKKSN